MIHGFENLFADARVNLPAELEIPKNFTYEKMIYDIAGYYGIDPKDVERNWDVYDYFEHLVFKFHRQKVQEYINESARQQINNI